jgi:hypothetical protein
MTQPPRFHDHTAESSRHRRRSPLATDRPGRRPSVRRVSEAVVASYIHDISQRHRDELAAPRGPRVQPTRYVS